MNTKQEGKAGELLTKFAIEAGLPVESQSVFGLARHASGGLYLGFMNRKHEVPGAFVDCFLIARLDADNNFDPDYGVGGVATFDASVAGLMSVSLRGQALLLDEDGGVIIIGDNGPIASKLVVLARLTADGNLDESFGFNGAVVHRLDAVSLTGFQPEFSEPEQSDPRDANSNIHNRGVLLASGKLQYASDTFIARFLADGSLDREFAQDGVALVSLPEPWHVLRLNGVVELSDNKIAICGQVRNSESRVTSGLVARYTEVGLPDTTFGDNGYVWVDRSDSPAAELSFSSITQGAGLSLVCAGKSLDYGVIACLDETGEPEPTFNNGKPLLFGVVGRSGVFVDIAVQSDSKFVAFGWSYSLATPQTIEFLVARFNSDGSRDLSFAERGWTVESYQGQSILNAGLLDNGLIVTAGTTLSTQEAVVMIFRA